MATSKLSAKASKLDFSKLPGMSPTSPVSAPSADGSARPTKTAPGALMAFANDARSDLMRENEELRARAAEADVLRGQLGDALGDLQQWSGAKAARLIDPKQIVASSWANRHELSFDASDFVSLRDEIANAGGNVQPIKVRAAGAGEGGEPRYEIVFGHRRHRACLELGLPVLAVIDNLDDRALFVEMDRENRTRKDLSAWEQGTMYQRALDQGLYPSNRKLSEAVGVDLSAVGKALALAKLPAEVVAAFPSPLALQFRWAKPLADAHAAEPDQVVARAKELAKGDPGRRPKDIFEALIAAAGQGGGTVPPPQPIHVDVDGERAAVVSQGVKGVVTITIDPGRVPAKQMEALAKLIQEFLAGSAKSSKGG